MAGIDEDGQVAHMAQGRHDAQIECVARVVGKGAHAALAEDHLVVALAHHILGGHQEFFHGRAHAALDKHRLAQLPGFLEERKILHIAGADLDHIGPSSHQVKRFGVERLGDDGQPKSLPDLSHNLQGFKTQALKSIG